jgi:hypothetical protein
MYTIDLLKGEGVPIRSRPGGIAFACLVVVLPFLASIGAVSVYMDSNVVIAIKQQQVNRLATTIGALSGAVQKKDTLEREKTRATGMLSEVKAALEGRTQWSPVLACLAESLSDALVLTKLEIRQDTVRCKVPAKDDPKKEVDASVPVHALRICVCGKNQESASQAVRELQESLRSSAAIGPKLDTITISQSATSLDSQEAVLYELNCVFKPVIP